MADSQRTLNSEMLFLGLFQGSLRVKPLILLAFLTRLLGPEGYGQIAALTAFLVLASNLSTFGLNSSIQVFLPKLSRLNQSQHFWGLVLFCLLLNLVVAASLLLGQSVFLNWFFAGQVIAYHFQLTQANFGQCIIGQGKGLDSITQPGLPRKNHNATKQGGQSSPLHPPTRYP